MVEYALQIPRWLPQFFNFFHSFWVNKIFYFFLEKYFDTLFLNKFFLKLFAVCYYIFQMNLKNYAYCTSSKSVMMNNHQKRKKLDILENFLTQTKIKNENQNCATLNFSYNIFYILFFGETWPVNVLGI